MKFYRAQHIYPFYRPKGILSRVAHLSSEGHFIARSVFIHLPLLGRGLGGGQ
jgi:hypothetical protein